MTEDHVAGSQLRSDRSESLVRRFRRAECLGCRSANGLQMATGGRQRQRAASSVSTGRQLPVFAASCRVLPLAAGLGW